MQTPGCKTGVFRFDFVWVSFSPEFRLPPNCYGVPVGGDELSFVPRQQHSRPLTRSHSSSSRPRRSPWQSQSLHLSCMGRNEVPALELQHLVRRGERSLVYHAGTGEVQAIEEPVASGFLRHVGGEAVIEAASGQRFPTAQLLRKAIIDTMHYHEHYPLA